MASDGNSILRPRGSFREKLNDHKRITFQISPKSTPLRVKVEDKPSKTDAQVDTGN